MISPVSQSLFSITDPPMDTYNSSWITKTKLKKVAMGFFGTFGILIGSAILVAGFYFSTFIALPLLGGSGYLFWKIQKLSDYDDPTKLKEYRKLAATEPLEKTIKSHGWKNTFAYQIPPKAEFQKLYNQSAQNKSILGIIDWYEKATDAKASNPSFSVDIPHPKEFRRNWLQEIKGKKLSEVLSDYDIGQLARFNIITSSAQEKLKEAKKQYFEAKKTYDLSLENTERKFKTDITAPLKLFSEIIQKAASNGFSHHKWLRKIYHALDYLKDLYNSLFSHDGHADLKIALKSIFSTKNTPADHQELLDAHLTFIRETHLMKSSYERKIREAKSTFESASKQINQNFGRFIRS